MFDLGFHACGAVQVAWSTNPVSHSTDRATTRGGHGSVRWCLNKKMDEQVSAKSQKSEALQALENKLEDVMRLVKLMEHRWEQVSLPAFDAANKVKAFIGRAQQEGDRGTVSGPMTDLKAAVDEVAHFVGTMTFLNDWMLVMLVSFVEAYLEDVLTQLVAAEPTKLMRRSSQKLSYAEVWETGSLRDVIKIMQQQWAKVFLNDKPGEWLKRLEKLGAIGYRTGLGEEMTRIWERRHTIIHSGGTRHMSVTEFQQVLGVIDNFVKPTDRFVVGFLDAHPSS